MTPDTLQMARVAKARQILNSVREGRLSYTSRAIEWAMEQIDSMPPRPAKWQISRTTISMLDRLELLKRDVKFEENELVWWINTRPTTPGRYASRITGSTHIELVRVFIGQRSCREGDVLMFSADERYPLPMSDAIDTREWLYLGPLEQPCTPTNSPSQRT